MQTLTRRHMVVINHLKTMDENVKWMKVTYLLSILPLSLRAPFCTSIFTSLTFIALLDVHTREKQYQSSPKPKIV